MARLRRPRHARPQYAVPREPWSPGELLAAGWCAGVFTFAVVGFLARILA